LSPRQIGEVVEAVLVLSFGGGLGDLLDPVECGAVQVFLIGPNPVAAVAEEEIDGGPLGEVRIGAGLDGVLART
jgi:hypothetical protein